jgi:hypothetical protein
VATQPSEAVRSELYSSLVLDMFKPRITAAELERCEYCRCSRRACGCDDYLDKQEMFS